MPGRCRRSWLPRRPRDRRQPSRKQVWRALVLQRMSEHWQWHNARELLDRGGDLVCSL